MKVQKQLQSPHFPLASKAQIWHTSCVETFSKEEMRWRIQAHRATGPEWEFLGKPGFPDSAFASRSDDK